MAACVPCLSSRAKALLAKRFPAVAEHIRALGDCPGDLLFNLCGRKLSAYQTYVKTCMADQKAAGVKGGEAMSACAAEWKARKP